MSGLHLKVEQHLRDKNVQPVTKPGKPQQHKRKPDDYDMLIYDLETSGLRKDAEIIQVACVDLQGREFATYIMPKKAIDPGASKATGLSVGYSQGMRTLCKDGKPVEPADRGTAIKGLSEFLKNQSSNKPTLLIAHNGQSFDLPRLVANIVAEQSDDFSNDSVFFGSPTTSRNELLHWCVKQ